MGRLSVLVTEEERRAIAGRAADAGLSLSEYVRRAALSGGAVLAREEFDLLRQVLVQLRGAATNLNSLVRDARMVGAGLPVHEVPTAARLEEAIGGVGEIRRRFEEMLRRWR
jgi:hypothetical protein